MLQDPNVERIIEERLAPLQKQIESLQKDLATIKQALNIDIVSDYYLLKDGDDILKGDEYFQESDSRWILVDESELPDKFIEEDLYKHRRKL